MAVAAVGGGDGADDLRLDRVAGLDVPPAGPRIVFRVELPNACSVLVRDASLAEDHHVKLIADLGNLAATGEASGPRHLGDEDEDLVAVVSHEQAEVRRRGDFRLDDLPRFERHVAPS